MKCYLCERFAVHDGFCVYHLKIYKNKIKEFKKNFIQFMLEKDTMLARNEILDKVGEGK
jgi:hypothetical protein